MLIRFFSASFAAILLSSVAAPLIGAAVSAPAVPSRVPIAVDHFDLADVRLEAGPFRDAQERDRGYLLRLEPDRLLHTFRVNVKLPSNAEPYGGWEGPEVELRGHSLGHYLSACSLMYRSTGDAEFKRRIDYIVAELAKCQAASPQAGFHAGYLSAFPESFIDRVESRRDVWAPWYTLHKIMAGLYDAHTLADNAQALEMLNQMAGWIKFRVDRLSREQMQASLQTEFGGMNEVLANLYAITGNPDHLRLAEAFDQAAVFDPLARGQDDLDGLHANTQIPKMIGAAREYELTGDAKYKTIAETFWNRVALHRSFVIGGHSDREHFFPVNDFAHHLSPETTETCNTYNMLKLTRHLFAWEPTGQEMDFYERALYNHILASQDPAQGMFVYLMSLEPGHYKMYSTPENSFWCCVGTGMENHAKYGDTIYSHDDRSLYINLFIASHLRWSEKGIELRQVTAFPEENTTRLIWSVKTPTELALRIRHPQWSAGALSIAVNGEAQKVDSAPGSYAEVKRVWQNGDRVEVRFAMGLHTETLPGDEDIVAVLYGPIVLAGKLGDQDMPNPYERDQLDQARLPHPAVPAFVSASSDWLEHIEQVSQRPLLFRTRGLARPREVVLAPFYQVHHERNAVYWRLLSPDAWAQDQAAVASAEKRWAELPKSAIDYVAVGDPASEGAHHFVGEKTISGTLSGRGWRQAQHGAGFSYELSTARAGASPLALACAFGSRDQARDFTIEVDGQVIATPKPDGSAPGEVYLQSFPLPAALLTGKRTVKVTFQASAPWDAATANVFACALVAQP